MTETWDAATVGSPTKPTPVRVGKTDEVDTDALLDWVDDEGAAELEIMGEGREVELFPRIETSSVSSAVVATVRVTVGVGVTGVGVVRGCLRMEAGVTTTGVDWTTEGVGVDALITELLRAGVGEGVSTSTSDSNAGDGVLGSVLDGEGVSTAGGTTSEEPREACPLGPKSKTTSGRRLTRFLDEFM